MFQELFIDKMFITLSPGIPELWSDKQTNQQKFATLYSQKTSWSGRPGPWNFFCLFYPWDNPGSLKKCQPIRSSRLAEVYGTIYTNVVVLLYRYVSPYNNLYECCCFII